MSSTLVQLSPSWSVNIDGDVRVCTQRNIYDILICMAHIDTGTVLVSLKLLKLIIAYIKVEV